MAYKLGTAKQAYAVGGEIKNKLSFLKSDMSVPGTPVIVKDLGPGVVAEANMDGSIFLSHKVDPNDPYTKYTLNHEQIHAKNMKISPMKLGYYDDHVMYEGERWERRTRYNKDMIQDPNNKEWKEAGDKKLPWEIDAEKV